MRNRVRRSLTVFTAGAVLLLGPLEGLAGQGPDPLPARAPSAIRWYHAGAALAGIALFSLADESLRDELQRHRTGGGDDLARVAKTFGEAEIFLPVALGTLAAGAVAGDAGLQRAGGRITAGLLLAGATSSLLKATVGRARPRAGTTDAWDVHPFGGATSWPSGHTTMAFALATGVGDEIGSLPVSLGLYSAATLTGWSRLNDDRHWLSDVLTGAAIGITSAKLMNGRWRVLGIKAPDFLIGPGHAAVRWTF